MNFCHLTPILLKTKSIFQVQSYYHREIYTICYVLVAAWPAMYGLKFVRDNASLCGTWAFGCIAMSVFTLLPAIKTENPKLIQLGGLLILVSGFLYLAFEDSLLTPKAKATGIGRIIFGVQIGLVALAMVVTWSSVTSLQAKEGLPLGTQMVGWIALGKSD